MKYRTTFILGFSALISQLAFGIGYDFNICANAVNELALALEESGAADDIPELQRAEWSNRQARIAYIRQNEQRRVRRAIHELQEAKLNVSAYTQDYIRAAGDQERLAQERKHLSETRDPEANPLQAKAVDEFFAQLETGAGGDTGLHEVSRNLAVQQSRPSEAQEYVDGLFNDLFHMLGGRDEIAYAVAKDMGIDVVRPNRMEAQNRVLAAVRNPIAAEIYPPQAPTLKQDTRNVMGAFKVMPEVAILSELRMHIMERLAGTAPLDKPLADVAPEETQKAHAEELGVFHAKLTAPSSSKLKPEKVAKWADRFAIKDPLRRGRFLLAARRLAASGKVSSFYAEDLRRQIKFVEDLDLPIDVHFFNYVRTLIAATR